MDTTTTPQQWNIPIHRNGCLELHQCEDAKQAYDYASWLIPQFVNRHTIMMICHGESLLRLYLSLLAGGNSEPCAITMGDEIMGEAFHLESHELDYMEAGLIDLVSRRGIPFYRILSRSPSLQGTLRLYSSTLRSLMEGDRQLHVFVELRDDGSVAGINSLGEITNCMRAMSGLNLADLMIGIPEEQGVRHRVSVSKGMLTEADDVWAFALGENKRWILDRMLDPDLDMSETCAATLLRDCRGRVHLITDQVL